MPLYPCLSIHTPAKGATFQYYTNSFFLRNFNPRSREGSDMQHDGDRKGLLGFRSTLPRRERPPSNTLSPPLKTISIHAPAKGATRPRYSSLLKHQNFNPRSREGSDQTLSSIESPLCDFNPRSREGSDILKAQVNDDFLKFQSTLPRRERRIPFTPRQACVTYFNPRSREGSDLLQEADHLHQIVFQSTLPRRERLRALPLLFPATRISIHAPAKGATQCGSAVRLLSCNFNPCSREGSDIRLVLAVSQ